MQKGNLPNGVHPLRSFVLGLDVEHSLDDGGELQTANDECVGPWTINRHDLTAGHGEVVGGLVVGDLSVWQVLVADQGAIGAQDEVTTTPVLDVLATLKQPSFFDDFT